MSKQELSNVYEKVYHKLKHDAFLSTGTYPSQPQHTPSIYIESQDTIHIVTAEFVQSDIYEYAYLKATKSTWKITGDRYELANMQHWTPREFNDQWYSVETKAPQSHKRLISKLLMELWDLGKLRGRRIG